MTDRYKVKDMKLAEAGRLKIEWAEARMPVLMSLRRRFEKERPLAGHRVAGCLHVTKEAAVLIGTLQAAGAEVAWSGCNPLSTQDDVAAALAQSGTSIFAWHGLSRDDFYACIDETLKFRSTLTLDDGADLIMRVHNKRPDLLKDVVGGTEETTTGVHRLRKMAQDKKLRYPVVAVNDAVTKWDFDNVYGTGQSSLDGILRATSVLIAGKTFVTAGYGHCGRGCAMRAQGLGATTVVTEVEPQAALKAMLDGHRVMTMDEAVKVGDIFITATGVHNVIVGRHFAAMRDGAIVCNTGHYDCELNVAELREQSVQSRVIRPNCTEYLQRDGRRIYLLAEGRLVNLAAAEGHPSEVMDMSFANQLLSMVHVAKEGRTLSPAVYPVSVEQDQEIARIKLATSSVKIDTLSDEQRAYQDDYLAGT